MGTKGWLIRTIPLFVVLGVLFGWHDWSDHKYLELIFGAVVIAVFEGDLLLRDLKEEQRQNKVLLERLEEGQRQHTLLLERLEEGQRLNTLLLERVGAQQEKLARQQIRETIVLEGILANMPLSVKMPNDDCGTP